MARWLDATLRPHRSSMNAAARTIVEGQIGVHPRLEEIVLRHLRETFARPVAPHTRSAFEAVTERLDDRPLVLDSGCGTGWSTGQLARRYPESLVVGVDRSEVRLSRETLAEPNVVRVRADLVDFWRLAVNAGWRLAHHYLLYPNPYPKPGQVQRRWHAHAVFPALLMLGGQLELRTNWSVYAEEMAVALRIAGFRATVDPLDRPEGLSRFEVKYAEAGQQLQRVLADLDAPVAAGP